MFVFEKIENDKFIVKSYEKIKGKLIKDEDGYFYYCPELKNEKYWDSLMLKAIAVKLDSLNKNWDSELSRNLISKIKIK